MADQVAEENSHIKNGKQFVNPCIQKKLFIFGQF